MQLRLLIIAALAVASLGALAPTFSPAAAEVLPVAPLKFDVHLGGGLDILFYVDSEAATGEEVSSAVGSLQSSRAPSPVGETSISRISPTAFEATTPVPAEEVIAWVSQRTHDFAHISSVGNVHRFELTPGYQEVVKARATGKLTRQMAERVSQSPGANVKNLGGGKIRVQCPQLDCAWPRD